jgi:hypothetical protein
VVHSPLPPFHRHASAASAHTIIHTSAACRRTIPPQPHISIDIADARCAPTSATTHDIALAAVASSAKRFHQSWRDVYTTITWYYTCMYNHTGWNYCSVYVLMCSHGATMAAVRPRSNSGSKHKPRSRSASCSDGEGLFTQFNEAPSHVHDVRASGQCSGKSQDHEKRHGYTRRSSLFVHACIIY